MTLEQLEPCEDICYLEYSELQKLFHFDTEPDKYRTKDWYCLGKFSIDFCIDFCKYMDSKYAENLPSKEKVSNDLYNYCYKTPKKMTLEQLETCIVNWAHIRGIAAPDNSRNQLLKTVEELGELSRATLKNDKAGIKDGIGDVLVTLIIFAHTQGLDINTCLDAAWQEIKDRTGLTVNGTFIKNG